MVSEFVKGRKEVSPVFMRRNRKSRCPCCQEQGQVIWLQPQLGC